MRIKLLGLDFDGVINYSTIPSWYWHKKIARQCGFPVPTFTLLRHCWHGVWETDILPALAKELNWPAGAVSKFINTYRASGFIHCLVPNFMETVNPLKKQGLMFAIVSSRDQGGIVRLLHEFAVPPYLFVLIQGHDNHHHHKPDARSFDPLFARANELGIKQSEIVFVGDTVVADLAAACACQPPLNFIAFVSGASTRCDFLKAGLPPEFITSSFKKLPAILQKF